MLFLEEEFMRAESIPPYLSDVWMEHIQVMAAREGVGRQGFFLAAKGGHNDEHHNHNDIGQFVVYYNGLPVVIDIGPETYSAKTFGPQRYEIWTMRSAYHNVPLVNGCEQPPGSVYAAAGVRYEADEREAALFMSLAEAYPPEADLVEWQRTCSLRRCRGEASAVAVTDSFRLKAPTYALRMHFMTRYKPEVITGSSLLIKLPDGTSLEMKLDTDSGILIEIETIRLQDERVTASWGEEVYRVALSPTAPVGSGTWTYTLSELNRNL
jgi:hypothetical protein